MPDPASPPSFVQAPAAAFLNSLEVDRPFLRYDLVGSIAHVRMLRHVGLLSPAEADRLIDGLRVIGHEAGAGTFPWRSELEDVHTNVEVRLAEIAGPVAGKLHTGRSRNDQIAVDERLYLRSAVHGLVGQLTALQESLLRQAEAHRETPMPGYTHLQRAQLVSVGHVLLAHFWRFDRDVDRLLTTERRADVSPLGAGALAGSTLPLDPAWTARELGFAQTFENSLDAVSDRDSFAELLFDLALVGVHASALGEDLVLYATKEFGYLERSPALGSGSSLMPQKRNPDVAELIRGKAGRSIGDLVTLLTVLKGLPLGYDRDLQEDKAPVLDSVATTSAVLAALTALVGGLRFDGARLAEASRDRELYATDVAETLVRGGVPFREAHEAVGAHLRASPPVAGPSPLASTHPAEAEELELLREPTSALARRTTAGGPSPAAVAVQADRARSRLAAHAASLSSLARKVERTEELLNEERK